MKLRAAGQIFAIAVILSVIGALSPRLLGTTTATEGPGSASSKEATTPRELAAAAEAALRKLRTHADPAAIPEAQALLEASLRLDRVKNFEAFLGMASLSNARHDFSASVRWARRAIEVNPFNAAPYGVLGDALFELGQVDAADRAYQKMIDVRPDVGAYVRASYAAQSHGNYPAAVHALRQALEASPPLGEEAAFVHHQLGDVFAAQGRASKAEEENRLGMKKAPGFVPPEVGVAEALIAQDRWVEAEKIMQSAAERLPAIEYLVTLGDLRSGLEDHEGALEAYERAAQRLADYRAAGVLPDVDLITFYADHEIRREAAVEEARAVYENRPTPGAADALAWALHSAGRDEEAWRHAQEALRSETIPEAAHHFHAAVIAEGLGKTAVAKVEARKALSIDPYFSLFHLSEAKRLAERA